MISSCILSCRVRVVCNWRITLFKIAPCFDSYWELYPTIWHYATFNILHSPHCILHIAFAFIKLYQSDYIYQITFIRLPSLHCINYISFMNWGDRGWTVACSCNWNTTSLILYNSIKLVGIYSHHFCAKCSARAKVLAFKFQTRVLRF